MAIKLMDTLETAGDFPIINAPSVGLPTGKRLDALFDDDGKIKSDSLPPVETADARLDELLDDDGNIKAEKLPDIDTSDPRVDELMENVNAMFDTDGKLKEEYLPEIEATDPRVDELMEVAGNMFDENGKIAEELLPEEKKPASINLTNYASNGTIVEQYADGSTVTHTVEFNAEGKPVSVTTNGVTTTMTW